MLDASGSVYRVGDAYERELALGSIAQQSIGELLESPEYAASIQRDGHEYAQHCEGCEYRVGCMGGFIYDTRPAFEYEGSCVTAWHCIRFMQKFIVRLNSHIKERADGHYLVIEVATPVRRIIVAGATGADDDEPTRVDAHRPGQRHNRRPRETRYA